MKLARLTIILAMIIVLFLTAACARKQLPSVTEPDAQDELAEHNLSPVEDELLPDNVVLAMRFAADHLIVSPGMSYTTSLHATGSEHDIPNLFDSDDHLIVLTSSNPLAATINQHGMIFVAASAAVGSQVTLQAQSEHLSAMLHLTVSYDLEHTVETVTDGVALVTNPESIAVIVNKERSLPHDYEPDDLVKPDVPFSFSGENERKYLRKEAAIALENLFKHAEEDGIVITAVSGYRTFATQRALFNHYVSIDGEEKARQYSALPGTSEHQTGLAMDVSAPSIGNKISTEAGFEHTEEGIWLRDHAAKHGFIIRYPEDKEHITGYVYEPWHLRYVGVELAELISEQGITLEEFFQSTIPVMSNVSTDS